MPSANVFFTPTESFYVSFGAYYSNRSEGFGNLVGSPQDIQPSDPGAFLFGETGMRWRHAPVSGGDGNLKLGGLATYWNIHPLQRFTAARYLGLLRDLQPDPMATWW